MHVATETFTAKIGNTPVVVGKGEFVDDDHELVARFPQWFKRSEPRFASGGVEQATKSPGEKRGPKAAASDG